MSKPPKSQKPGESSKPGDAEVKRNFALTPIRDPRDSPPDPRAREMRVINRAERVIGDRDETMRWLGTPIRALGYATPISKLGDEAGVKEVLAVLDRLEQGVW